MALHGERRGRGPAVALVHGFTQTLRSWDVVASDLETDHEVVLIDAPGHGRSAPVVADLATGGLLIGEAGGRATYVGYSMGARFCLHLALDHPDLVTGLVLLGATAGIEDPAERAARREQDRRTADRLDEVGLETFLVEWLAQPLFSSLDPDQAGLADRLANSPAGLRSSLEQAGTGTQVPLWDRLDTLTMPVLVVAGARDERYSGLAHRLAAAIGPSATAALVPDAGHAAHLEQPGAFVALVRAWLDTHGL